MTSGDTAEPRDEPTPPTGEKAAKSKTGKPAKHQGGVVPRKAAEDDPRTWGDSDSDHDHDAWLKEQRPPHWG